VCCHEHPIDPERSKAPQTLRRWIAGPSRVIRRQQLIRDGTRE
jgi:hypothetical protein